MKTNILVVSAFAGMLALTSCSNKATEQTLNQIASFESTWTEAGNQANTFSQELKANVEKSTENITKIETALTAATKEEVKTQLNELATAAKNDKAAFEAMYTEYTAFQESFDADTKSFTEFKEKVTKGEINNDEAIKNIADYTAKVEAVKVKVEGWATAYTTAKEAFAKNTEAVTEAEKVATQPATKEEKGNKKM